MQSVSFDVYSFRAAGAVEPACMFLCGVQSLKYVRLSLYFVFRLSYIYTYFISELDVYLYLCICRYIYIYIYIYTSK